MGFEKISYDNLPDLQHRKPLMIGCSGGGGHIAAIRGIREYLSRQFGSAIDLPQYNPVLFDSKSANPSRDKIATGVELMHAPAIGGAIKSVVSLTPFPVLPDSQSLLEEVYSLSNKERGKPRPYIDMLLDVYPAGYESAAIWNVLQRNDKTSELKKLINLQSISDKENHDVVLKYYLKALKDAAISGTPYTEIISTQAMALPALCDAVMAYNQWIDTNPNIKAPQIVVHQYMTDLPSKGAVHFFNPLSQLSPEQQHQMKLYGVGMNKEIIKNFFPSGHQFNEIYTIPAHENPMVRAGFLDGDLDNSSKFHEQVSLTLANEAHPYTIKADEQIASIMLGSQASNDTVEYIETLLENGMEKVFVFGGKTPTISAKINEILSTHPEYKERIIPLDNQGDREIASLMSRSNMVIIRGGGLSVMEQLSMNHSPEQTVLIHHANSNQKELSSGISWEDDNVNVLIADLNARGVRVGKTSPERAIHDIAEARLIAAVKRLGDGFDVDDASFFISRLPKAELKLCVDQLNKTERENPPKLPVELITHFNKSEVQAEIHIGVLNGKLNKGREYLASVILKEIAKAENEERYSSDDEAAYSLLERKSDFDVNDIVHDFELSVFKDVSSRLATAVQSYRAIDKLQATLSFDNNLSMHKRLNAFKEEYNKPETRKDLMATSDNIFVRIIQGIQYQLARYFPAVASNLTFQQDFKMHADELVKNNNDDIAPAAPRGP